MWCTLGDGVAEIFERVEVSGDSMREEYHVMRGECGFPTLSIY